VVEDDALSSVLATPDNIMMMMMMMMMMMISIAG